MCDDVCWLKTGTMCLTSLVVWAILELFPSFATARTLDKTVKPKKKVFILLHFILLLTSNGLKGPPFEDNIWNLLFLLFFIQQTTIYVSAYT